MVSYVARTARQGSFFGVTASAFAFSADIPKCLSPIKDEYRDALAKRLDAYLKANHSQNWAELFALVSDAARGGLEREAFVARIKAAHRKDFSNSPDLIEFKPDRAAKGDGREYDVTAVEKLTARSESSTVSLWFTWSSSIAIGSSPAGRLRNSRINHVPRYLVHLGNSPARWSGISPYKSCGIHEAILPTPQGEAVFPR